jgi:murein L,D-transpeptidase YcbB/YkuD
MFSCREKTTNPNINLTLSDFDKLDTSAYALNSHRIREYLDVMINADNDSMAADNHLKGYYINKGGFLWIDRCGVDNRAEILLNYISKVNEMGFSRNKFRYSQIERDLRRARELDFDTSHNSINRVMARLEYNLTKAYLRYVVGQRFGFFNPSYELNRLDPYDMDSTVVSYRKLFDIPMEKPDRTFYITAMRKIGVDSVAEFLKDIQPKDKLYWRFYEKLKQTNSKPQRIKILCNMERCRWRLKDSPDMHDKYVLVNIPSFRLRAVDGKKSLEMRIGCGSFETKTPLLTSAIMRMDINPQWIVPRSIIKKSIINRIGNRSYFESHRFFIRERKTGKKISFDKVTWGMLNSSDYLVVQAGGVGNSLGRIIFRFDNSFSVFIHDTDQHGVFSQEDRGVSHGCVRVQKPFSLAVFMLNDKNEDIISKIKYSMTAQIGGENTVSADDKKESNPKLKTDTLDHSRILSMINVTPKVPLFITYFTLYPDFEGNIKSFSDVYGYDKVIFSTLKNYLGY